MNKHWKKRLLCGILACMLVLEYIPVPIFASEADGLCAHHTAHTPECGYSPAVEGHECGHVHTEECYQYVTVCVHEHDETCGYAEGACGHVCSGESGCVTRTEACQHVHDESCGYVAAVLESPCAFMCAECAAAEKEAADKAAAGEVATLIDALPTLEEVKAMSTEEQAEAYTQVQKAYDAYNALTDDQKALIPDAESTFTSLFEYFNTLTAPADVTASGSCGTRLTWVFEDGTLTISGSGDMYGYSLSGEWGGNSSQITKVVVESGVTSIGANAFSGLKSLETVEIASTVQSIGQYAFKNCSNLQSVNIPNGITEIQESTFLNCSSLVNVSIPNTVTVIRESAFNGCSGLTEVDIPDSVTTIEQDAFISSGLTSVTFPGNLSTITFRSFLECEQLRSVVIPSSVKTIEYLAFGSCTNLTDVYYEGSKTDWNDISINNINNCNDDLLNATIHFNWKCVNGHQFSDGVCTVCGIKGGYCGLQGENLIWILDDEGNLTISGEGEMADYSGENAPWGHGIVSVVIKDGVTNIGYRAFEDCTKLASAILPNGITEIRDWAFEGCAALTQIAIPESVTSVAMWAFALTGLTSVTIPSNVTKIEQYTFAGCESLTSVAIPEGVTSIGREAFSNCPKLAELTLPSSLTTIGISAFDSCLSLKTVTIPENVTSIGGNAFGNAIPDNTPQLTTILFKGHGFQYTSNDSLVASSVTAYYPADDSTWTQEIRDSFVGPITWVAAECPVNGTHIVVTDAGYSASCTQDGLTDGSHCSACGKILVAQEVISTIDHTKETVPGKAATCTEDGLTDGTKCSVCGKVLVEQQVIPAGHNFEDGVCSGCGLMGGTCGENLSYTIVDGVLTITGSGSMDNFGDCGAPWYEQRDEIQSVVFSEKMDSIGSFAFADCEYLSEITIPKNISFIGKNAFRNCPNLKTITFGHTAEDSIGIAANAFYVDTSTATVVNVPDASKINDSVSAYPWNGDNRKVGWNGGAEATQLTLVGLESDSYLGQFVGRTYHLSLFRTPAEAFVDMAYTSGDSSVLEIVSGDESGCFVTVKKPGTVTITATDRRSGVTTEKTVRIADSQVITAPYQEDILIGRNLVTRNYTFTPDKSGTYLLTTTACEVPFSDSVRFCVARTDSGAGVEPVYEYPEEDVCRATVKLTAGVTYLIQPNYAGITLGRVADFRLEYVDNSSATDSIQLPYPVIDCDLSPTGWEYFAGAQRLPVGSETPMAWESLNPEVASVSYTDDAGCWFVPESIGTAKLKVTCGETSEEVTVNVHAPQIIALDETLSVSSYVSTSNRLLSFTAPETGRYAFTVEGADRASVILDSYSVGKEYANNYGENSETVFCNLQKGDTYVFGVEFPQGKAGTVTATVQLAAQAPEKLELILTGRYTNSISLGVSFFPRNSTDKIVSWQVSDPEILYYNPNDAQYSQYSASFIIRKQGEVTVTATSESGLTASYTLTVGTCPDGQHSYESKTIAPTCTENGYTLHTCSVCSDVYADNLIKAKGHTETIDKAKAPTCTETGLTEGSHCSVCGKILAAQEVLSAKGHTLKEVAETPATCTANGVKAHYHCSECKKNFADKNGETELTDVVISASHTLKEVAETPATCTANGTMAHYHCSACGKDFEDEKGAKELSDISIPASDHHWGDWKVTTPATPEADGEETRKCASCQKEETRPLPYTADKLELTGTGLENQSVVWIDGVPVPVEKDDTGNPYVTLPENSSSILVTYSFNTGSADRHTQYPTGMQVYRIEETDSGMTVTRLPELQNLLQYSGCSIRITGVKGIRMITSISKSVRSALTGGGLAGYKLVEYGTALCRASVLEGGAPMVLGTSGVKSNYAYKRDVADPIFKDTGSAIQYTNVLVGFTDEDCKEDIAMRPYIILEDENGDTVTIYGGIVYRSVGYIAYQNRSAFTPGSAAYQYVWDIIHYVYGDQYDADYKK
ncbi:MAG: leucine-rich repeat domain-containing protein [Faecousia sp.]